MPQLDVKLICAAALIVLVGLLTGCATNSQPSAVNCPTLPQMPLVSEPIPSQSYSETALQNIEAWRNRLIGTPRTSGL